MSDHSTDTTTLLVTLNTSELVRAARLGGLPIALDEKPIDNSEPSMELIRFFAKRGITHAIYDSFDRGYPL